MMATTPTTIPITAPLDNPECCCFAGSDVVIVVDAECVPDEVDAPVDREVERVLCGIDVLVSDLVPTELVSEVGHWNVVETPCVITACEVEDCVAVAAPVVDCAVVEAPVVAAFVVIAWVVEVLSELAAAAVVVEVGTITVKADT